MKQKFRPLILALSALMIASPALLAGCNQKDEALAPLPPEFEEEPMAPSTERPGETITEPEPTPNETPSEPNTPIEPNETPAVTLPNEPAPNEPKPSETRISYLQITASELNVRTGAGTKYSSLGTVDKGELIAFGKKENGWYETRYRNKTAYVSASDKHVALVEMEQGSKEVERVIAQGLDCLGVPYVYGAVRLHDGEGHKLKGFTKEKFDCSSLMQYLFYEGAGVLLGTTTRTQVLQGKAVQSLQRGDLLFFTNASRKNLTGIERVGHVGLYLGNNYMLHTSSDYAKIEKISAARWDYFIKARRVL